VGRKKKEKNRTKGEVDEVFRHAAPYDWRGGEKEERPSSPPNPKKKKKGNTKKNHHRGRGGDIERGKWVGCYLGRGGGGKGRERCQICHQLPSNKEAQKISKGEKKKRWVTSITTAQGTERGGEKGK